MRKEEKAVVGQVRDHESIGMAGADDEAGHTLCATGSECNEPVPVEEAGENFGCLGSIGATKSEGARGESGKRNPVEGSAELLCGRGRSRDVQSEAAAVFRDTERGDAESCDRRPSVGPLG
ncbi:MAG: hypothetical protein ACI9C1_001346 [Candidatus Aldehydirespiratoraceae bacterium]